MTRVLIFRDAAFWCLGAAAFHDDEARRWKFIAAAFFLWGLDLYVNRKA